MVAGTARKVGSGAKDLDPALRRDGLAFLLLALAIVIALREWFGLSGIAGDVIHHVAAGVVGVLGILLPLVLVAMAVRLMRHPERTQANVRVTVGIVAITAAVCGLVHIGADLPRPTDSFAAVESAGGLLGWAVGTPLTVLLSAWGAVPILVLLAVFGLLVVTATPVAAVPGKLSAAGGWLLGRAPEAAADDATTTEVVAADGTHRPPTPRRRGKKARAAEAARGRAGRVHRRRGLRPAPRPRPRRRGGDGGPGRGPQGHSGRKQSRGDGADRRHRRRGGQHDEAPRARARRRRPRRRCPPAPSSSSSRRTSSTRCPPTTCSSRAPRTRSARPPTTGSSRR